MTVEGRITTVNPLVDAETRNVQLQATVANREEKLRPGMFVNMAVGLPVRKKVIAIPATAVLYAPFGDSVFVVADDKVGRAARRSASSSCGSARGAATSSPSPTG